MTTSPGAFRPSSWIVVAGRLVRLPGAYHPSVPQVWPLPVDIRLVESFAAVAEELHFTRAAQRLSVSQPALSQQIARLERQLGAQLFTRLPGAVALTPAGAALWREVQPALAGLRAGISAARAVGAGVTGRLRVQHLSSYGPHVLPMVAAQLRETEPDLVVELPRRPGSIHPAGGRDRGVPRRPSSSSARRQ
jgi:DNA-binding transcriptional LysR family regulator